MSVIKDFTFKTFSCEFAWAVFNYLDQIPDKRNRQKIQPQFDYWPLHIGQHVYGDKQTNAILILCLKKIPDYYLHKNFDIKCEQPTEI